MKIDYRKFYLACCNAGISAVSAMDAANVSTCVLTSIKKGRSIRPITLKKIATALNVDPAELLEGE